MPKIILEAIIELYKENKDPLWRISIHLGLYFIAISIAYSCYKEFSKGYDHVISHFIGDYIDTPELPRAIKHSIKESFPWAALVFTVFYSVAYTRIKRESLFLSPLEYLVVIACTGFFTNLIFLANAHTLAVLNLSLSLFFILLCLWQITVLYPVKEWLINYLKESVAAYAAYPRYYLNRAVAPLTPSIEPFLVVQDRVKNNRWLIWLAGNPMVVLVLYFSTAVTAYLPTIDHLFRSDHWLFIALARSPDVTLREVCSFDMFGHMRLDPLRWLMFYEQNALLGDNMQAYHLLSISVHAVNGLLIYLIAKTILKSNIFSFLLGLMFIVLASHFDTVVWSLLFDFQISTFFYLTAVLCLTRYLWYSLSIANVYLAILFSAVPIFILESFSAAPMSIFLSLILLNYFSGCNKRADTERHIRKIVFFLLIVYVVFFYLTTLSQTHVTTEKMGFLDILTWKHIRQGLFAAFAAMVDMNFLNNSGVFPPKIEIHNLVNLHALGSWYKINGVLKFLVFAPVVSILFYYSATSKIRYFTLPILLMAASSLSAIGIGRIFTGGFNYIITRSHYAYFPNAMLLILLGMLIWPPAGRMKKLVIYLSIIMLIALNFKNTLFLNNEVDAAMKAMNTHHRRIASFLKQNPNATLFLNFIPHNQSDRFSMAMDIAFDILYTDRITKSVRKATHIYNPELAVVPVRLKHLPPEVKFPKGLVDKIFYNYSEQELDSKGTMSEQEREELLKLSEDEPYRKAVDTLFNRSPFIVNQNYSLDTDNNTLGDFTVEWLCSASPEYLKKEVAIIGSDKVYPKISITPAGFIEIQMMHPETGTLDTYGVPYPNRPLFENDIGQSWVWIIVEKQGQELCFVINGVLQKKSHLNCSYLGWQRDGRDLLGNYYRGVGENVQYGRRFVMIDGCKYKCGSLDIGCEFNYDIDTYYQ